MTGRDTGSLLAGRSLAPLNDRKVTSVANTFYGLDSQAPVQHDPDGPTRFVIEDENGEEFGRIYFGSDIYPGASVGDPNSALSMRAAAAHELSHFHRWNDQTELPLGVHRHLDEAQTSLDAALRYAGDLSAHEIQQLIRDAFQRLQMHRQEVGMDGGA